MKIVAWGHAASTPGAGIRAQGCLSSDEGAFFLFPDLMTLGHD